MSGAGSGVILAGAGCGVILTGAGGVGCGAVFGGCPIGFVSAAGFGECIVLGSFGGEPENIEGKSAERGTPMPGTIFFDAAAGLELEFLRPAPRRPMS